MHPTPLADMLPTLEAVAAAFGTPPTREPLARYLGRLAAELRADGTAHGAWMARRVAGLASDAERFDAATGEALDDAREAEWLACTPGASAAEAVLACRD
jgi:hypothetical protein